MWQFCAQVRMVVGLLTDPGALPVIDRMCEQFPDTPVVIGHLGRIGAGGPILDRDVAALCRLARHPRTMVKVSAFYALGEARSPYHDLLPVIRRVYEAFGPRRLMWASDCPFQVDPGHTYRDSIDLVRQHLDFLSDEDRAWMLRKTAQSLFF